MSWSILSEETAKQKREKKRKRKIKRGSKRGRYVVLGSRARNGRKSAIHCITCGNTMSPDATGDICSSCATGTEGKIEKYMDKMAPKPFKVHSNLLPGQTIEKKTQMVIPKMTNEK